MLCPLVEVDERVHGDADRNEVESSEIDVGAVWSEVAFVIYPTQLSDSIRERKNRRESELKLKKRGKFTSASGPHIDLDYNTAGM